MSMKPFVSLREPLMSDYPVLPIPELTDVDVAFPAHALDWMPAMEDIPEEFHGFPGKTEWNHIAASWFYNGLPADVKFYPREGVDPEKAIRAVKGTLGSFAPQHEHKEAAAAYMLASWFEKIEDWEKPYRKGDGE